MAKCGRPPVLDKIKRTQILAILGVGCSRRTAASYVGCAPSTIRHTAERDPEFAEQLGHAEYNAEINYLKHIQQAARKEQYWRAAAWALERKNPRDFARRGPDVITLDQIASLLAQFTEIIVEEVPVAHYRKNILKRFASLTANLQRSSRKKAPDDEH